MNAFQLLFIKTYFIRDGVRPYVELYQGDEKIKSTKIDYDKMRVFHISEGKVI